MGEKMDKLNELQAYTAQWCGEDGDLLISGIDEKDMTQEELDSPKQTVTMYTKTSYGTIRQKIRDRYFR